MSNSHDPEPDEEYWHWLAAALFLLIPVDMLTTLFAAAERGTRAEANPLMQWALDRGLPTLVLLHLAAVGLAVGFFWALVQTLRRTPPRYRGHFATAIELWLGFLLAAGLFVLANNLSVILLGESLL